MDREDRRAKGIKRVALERVVEICGRDSRVPAFEAESVELSGRGMHVRTPYLPELGAPLVCRLAERGREIVVEGTVAWRNPTDGGGEFGVKFTALDASSVETLKELCGLSAATQAAAAPAAKREQPSPEADVDIQPSPTGAPVKLHIEGLAAPMKARVRRDSGRRLHVGSNLEFLKVGRTLEIEDLELRHRKGARIDSVSIALDPESQVPQLVVALRYEGLDDGDTTPEPSVIAADGGGEEPESPAPSVAARGMRADSPVSASADEPLDDDELDDEDDDDAEALRDKLNGFASGAAKAAQVTQVALSRAGAGTARSMGVLFDKIGERVEAFRAGRGATKKRRVTAKAPPVPSQPNRRLRPQSGGRGEEATENPAKKKALIALSAGGLAVLLAAGAIALRGSADEKKPAVATAANAAAAPVAAGAPPAAGAPAPGAAAAKAPAATKNGIVADVPLFGPTPMATLEPAPLEPPPDEIGSADSADEGEPESEAPDESFDEAIPAAKVTLADEAEKPVAPWGTGRLHLPFVHRIKLDAPGTALEGSKKGTGFTVFLPKRKLLETGKAIARRDDRILDVRTSNEPGGARVTFVFQGKVPAYKVRLKKQYIEFFISSPEKS